MSAFFIGHIFLRFLTICVIHFQPKVFTLNALSIFKGYFFDFTVTNKSP